MPSIAVLGSSAPVEGSAEYELAREVGREIARLGGRVVCGGYGGGMKAACRGAAEGGGESLGVVLAGRGDPNRWVSRVVEEPGLSSRLARLRDESDAAIFLPRGLGTMLELVYFAESIAKGDIPRMPLVLLGDFWRETADRAVAEARGPQSELLARCVRFAETPEEAVRQALEPVE